MIATLECTETTCRTAVNRYLANMLGSAYQAGQGQLRNGSWRFMVTCQRADMGRTPAVGGISVDAVTGQVQTLSAEQIRELREAGAVQAAQARQELAKDEAGYVLRRHARIKANVWISDQIGMKIGAEEGIFIAQKPPVWRFSIISQLKHKDVGPLGLLDVDATTGQVIALTSIQIQTIQEVVSAAIRYCELATTTRL